MTTTWSGLFVSPDQYLDSRDPAWLPLEQKGLIYFVPARGRGNPAEVRISEECPEVIRRLRPW
jgi:hypothetical protein